MEWNACNGSKGRVSRMQNKDIKMSRYVRIISSTYDMSKFHKHHKIKQ